MIVVFLQSLFARSRWTALSLLLIGSTVAAQSMSSRTLSLSQGLPEYFVSGIVQDRAGFIWIATRDGLARYDGQHFKLFRHQPDNPRSLASNILLSLQTVSDSALLLQLENGTLQLFSPLTEVFSTLLTKQRLAPLHAHIAHAQPRRWSMLGSV